MLDNACELVEIDVVKLSSKDLLTKLLLYGDHTFQLIQINSFYREQLLLSGYQNDLR